MFRHVEVYVWIEAHYTACLRFDSYVYIICWHFHFRLHFKVCCCMSDILKVFICFFYTWWQKHECSFVVCSTCFVYKWKHNFSLLLFCVSWVGLNVCNYADLLHCVVVFSSTWSDSVKIMCTIHFAVCCLFLSVPVILWPL